jgi:hypothetical protein
MGDCNAVDKTQKITFEFYKISSTTIAASTFKFIIFPKNGFSYEKT